MKKFLFVLTVALLCNSFVVLSQTQEGDIELTEWEIYSPRDSNHHGNKPKTCATCFQASFKVICATGAISEKYNQS